MKKAVRIIALITLMVILIATFTGCASWKRSWKSLKSDWGGGLDRTVTLYDYSGNVIKTWSGKIDITDSEDEIFFDSEDGQRVVIHGGIVVCEENIDAE